MKSDVAEVDPPNLASLSGAVRRHLPAAAAGDEWAAYEMARAVHGSVDAYIAACGVGGVPVHTRMRGWGLYRLLVPVI